MYANEMMDVITCCTLWISLYYYNVKFNTLLCFSSFIRIIELCKNWWKWILRSKNV